MRKWFDKSPVSSIMSLAAGLVGAFVALFSLVDSLNWMDSSISRRDIDRMEIERTLAEMAELRLEMNSIKEDLKGISSLSEQSKLALKIQQLQRALQLLSAKQEKIENAITSNPAKALEIPLLQRDLENVKATNQASLTAIKEGVDRVYDLNKWLLGAMAISIVTLAIASFLKGNESTGGKP